MKHLFIVNPAAGKGKSLKCIPHIKNIFKGKETTCCIKVTEKPGHSTSLVKDFLHDGSCRVYSVGGDGTLNEVLNGMVGSASSLGIIPTGSGNDFIKSIDSGYNSGDIIERTVNGREVPVDIGKVNGKYFINIASIGFDAKVVYNADKFKKIPCIPSSLAYFISIIVTVFKYSNNYLEIQIDNKIIKTNFLLVAIANGKYYGGGMLPAPEAKLDDGLFDICLIEGMPRHKILRLFPKFIKGRHGDIDGVSFHRGKNITIQSDTDIAMNIDGEIEIVRNAVFEIIPGGINIVVPGRNGEEEAADIQQRTTISR